MSKHFDGDLLVGNAAEDSFARLLVAGRELWEHKKDRLCVETGNIAVEYETSARPNGNGDRHPSGIAVCKAYWFVIEYAPERRLVLDTQHVKHLARTAIQAGRVRWIGDDHRFHNALVPFAWFLATPPSEPPTPAPHDTDPDAAPTQLDRGVPWADITDESWMESNGDPLPDSQHAAKNHCSACGQPGGFYGEQKLCYPCHSVAA